MRAECRYEGAFFVSGIRGETGGKTQDAGKVYSAMVMVMGILLTAVPLQFVAHTLMENCPETFGVPDSLTVLALVSTFIQAGAPFTPRVIGIEP